ncbi:hypothetical protein EYC84_004617 [Monilinia fructicola]|uniref:Uncharacterized protein n=1 Tax=Monilinia fructicola TaxID=38448 RepID=A0A5M9K3Y1_MONFR|nr:hypothetical protein EYC84_004617 [Monilinia fructicola]
MQSKNCRVHVVLRLLISPRFRVTYPPSALGKLDPKSWEQYLVVFVFGPILDDAHHTSYTLRSAPAPLPYPPYENRGGHDRFHLAVLSYDPSRIYLAFPVNRPLVLQHPTNIQWTCLFMQALKGA